MSFKFTQLAIAALAAATALPSMAATERLSGASASSINVVKGLRTLCTNAGGTFSLFKTSASTSSLGNIFTANCSANFSGTTNQVQANVSGGSFGAVLATITPVAFIDPAVATCAAIATAGTEALSFLPAGEMRNCGTTGQSNQLSNGGYLDVEGPIFKALGTTGYPSAAADTDFVPAGFLQAFGVAVTSSLYNALQAYQVAKGQLPATCATASGAAPVTYTATGSTTPDCQPSISRAALAAYFASGNNQAKKAGANFLLGGTNTVKSDLNPAVAAIAPDVPLLSKITYCRRPDTSGTQAATQVYFLSNPTATGDLGGALGVAGNIAAPNVSNIGATYTAATNSGSGNVKDCLNVAATATPAGSTYGVGTLSLENNPIGGTDTYRFVKLNGQYASEGVAGASQTATAIDGRYDFVFQSFKYCPGGTCTPIIGAIEGALAAGASSPGLFLSSESVFTRGTSGVIATKPIVTKP